MHNKRNIHGNCTRRTNNINRGDICTRISNIKLRDFVRVYHTWQKGPNIYCNPFLPYILIPIKNNESTVVNLFKKIIFYTITILDSIIIIHKCVFTWKIKTRLKRQKKGDVMTRFWYTLKNFHSKKLKAYTI